MRKGKAIPSPYTQQAPLPFFESYDARKEFRRTLAGFILLYLPHYLTLDRADFHKTLADDLGDHTLRRLAITGFRGSAKSTFFSLALVLWAALEHPDKYPFIITCADTVLQSKINIANIKVELDSNEAIRRDYGTITGENPNDWTMEGEEEWQAQNLILNNGVRILARSRGQKVRGLRHRQHRPKLVTVDDAEDSDWIRKVENRDKTEAWLFGEVVPAIDDITGRLVVGGNFLHKDALMARLKKKRNFRHIEIPLIDENGKCTWPAKFPTEQSIEDLKAEVGYIRFLREYMLKVVPEEGQDVPDDWIKTYRLLPPEIDAHGTSSTGVDLAISKRETADYTAMVTIRAGYVGGMPRIYVMPNPVEARLSFKETIDTALALQQTDPTMMFYVEQVAYQQAAIEEMERQFVNVTAMRAGQDKRARLRAVATYIQNGTILFSEKGCEDLIMQITGFGIEAHDDLVDAFCYAVLGAIQNAFKSYSAIAL
jgi:predicted phage terminase large subunit-like protein